MRLTRLLEALLCLDESKKVDEMVKSILVKVLGGADIIDPIMDGIKALDQVKRSPNGRDAILVAKWVLTFDDYFVDAPREIGKLLDKKDSLKTIKNLPLSKLYDMYPEYTRMKEFIQNESEKVANGYKDDIQGTFDNQDADELSDEERSKLIRKEFGRPTLSVPGKVDVYRADNKTQAIKYSEGYSWCIGYKDASNQFSYYRNIKHSTAYFCFFREPESNKDGDEACVIHAMDNGKYRMTNGYNSNGSPVVSKKTVLASYPDLAPVIDKMVVDTVDKENRIDRMLNDFNLDEPLPLGFLCRKEGWEPYSVDSALKSGEVIFTRKDVRYLLNKDVILSDKLFEFILRYFEHGKVDPDDKDNLIGIYLRQANHPLTTRQRELIKDSTQMLKYYDKLFNEKLLDKQRAVFEAVPKHLEEEDEESGDLYVITGDYKFYTALPDVRIDVDTDCTVFVQHDCCSLEGLPMGAGYGSNNVEIDGNVFLESIEGDEVYGYGHVYIEKCKNLKSIELQEPGRVSIIDCTNVESIKITSDPSDFYIDQIKLDGLPNLESLEFYNIEKIDWITLNNCPGWDKESILSAVKGIEIRGLEIDWEEIDLEDDDTDEDDE